MKNFYRLNQRQGFTLLEMIVAVAIFGIVIGAILLMYQTGEQSYQSGETKSEMQQNARAVLDLLVTEIRQVGSDPAKVIAMPFVKTAEDSIEFMTDVRLEDANRDGVIGIGETDLGDDGIFGYGDGDVIDPGEHLLYYVSNDTLYREDFALYPTGHPQEGERVYPVPRPLITNVEDIEFTYYRFDQLGRIIRLTQPITPEDRFNISEVSVSLQVRSQRDTTNTFEMASNAKPRSGINWGSNVSDAGSGTGGGSSGEGPPSGGGTGEPPAIQIISPNNNALLCGDASFYANATDADGQVVSVKLYMDGAPSNAVNSSGDNWVYPSDGTWDTTTKPDGFSQLWAVAADDSGNVTRSYTVNVNIDNSPNIMITFPEDGSEIDIDSEQAVARIFTECSPVTPTMEIRKDEAGYSHQVIPGPDSESTHEGYKDHFWTIPAGMASEIGWYWLKATGTNDLGRVALDSVRVLIKDCSQVTAPEIVEVIDSNESDFIEGATISDTQTWVTNVDYTHEDAKVEKVEFYIVINPMSTQYQEEVLYNTEYRSEADQILYSTELNTEGYVNNLYGLRVKVYDELQCFVIEDMRTVRFENAANQNQEPTVAISSPEGGSILYCGETEVLSADAYEPDKDAGDRIEKVEFFVNDSLFYTQYNVGGVRESGWDFGGVIGEAISDIFYYGDNEGRFDPEDFGAEYCDISQAKISVKAYDLSGATAEDEIYVTIDCTGGALAEEQVWPPVGQGEIFHDTFLNEHGWDDVEDEWEIVGDCCIDAAGGSRQVSDGLQCTDTPKCAGTYYHDDTGVGGSGATNQTLKNSASFTETENTEYTTYMRFKNKTGGGASPHTGLYFWYQDEETYGRLVYQGNSGLKLVGQYNGSNLSPLSPSGTNGFFSDEWSYMALALYDTDNDGTSEIYGHIWKESEGLYPPEDFSDWILSPGNLSGGDINKYDDFLQLQWGATGLYAQNNACVDEIVTFDEACASQVAGCAPGTELFSDDFEDGMDKWTESGSSNWSIISDPDQDGCSILEKHNNDSDAYNFPVGYQSDYTSSTNQNYVVSARMKLGTKRYQGLLFRYQDDNNYWRLILQNNDVLIRGEVNGSWTNANNAKVDYSYSTDVWYTLKAFAAGDILKVKVWPTSQPEPVEWTIETIDDTFMWGAPGIYAKGSTYYDDYQVCSVEYDPGDPCVESPPEVYITSPTDGTDITAAETNIDISITSDRDVSSATLYINGAQSQSITGPEDYETFTYDFTGNSGSQTIKVSITDNAGCTANDEITVNVQSDIEPEWEICDGVLAYEDFESGMGNWSSNGSYSVMEESEGNTHVLDADGGEIIELTSVSADNYEVSYRFMPKESISDKVRALLFRYTNSNNYWRLFFYYDYVAIKGKVNSSWRFAEDKDASEWPSYSLSQDTWYYAKLHVSGSSINAKWWTGGADNEPVDWMIQVDDDRLMTGGVGLYNTGRNWYDDIMVCPVAPPTECCEGGFCDDFEDGSISPDLKWHDQDNWGGTSSSEADGVLSISARGSDVWGGSDAYATHYYDDITGDFDAVVQVVSQGGSHEWRKAGIMVKDDITQTTSDNGYLIVASTGSNGSSRQHDSNGNGELNSSNNDNCSESPIWLKLEKRGKEFTTYCSADGASWSKIDTQTLTDADDTQDVGLFVCSHNTGGTSTVEFDNFSVCPPVGADCFYDDFEGDLSQWVDQNGGSLSNDWKIKQEGGGVDNKYLQKKNWSTSDAYIVPANYTSDYDEASECNYEIVSRIRFYDRSGAYQGICFRWQESDTYIQLRQANGALVLDRKKDGGSQQLGSKNWTCDYDEWYIFKVQADGDNIKAKVWKESQAEPGSWDFDYTLTGDDASRFSWGAPGIVGYTNDNDGVHYDDFIVCPID